MLNVKLQDHRELSPNSQMTLSSDQFLSFELRVLVLGPTGGPKATFSTYKHTERRVY